MTMHSRPTACGFTLVELLIGATLAAAIMVAVLSSYVTLAKNFTRTLGLSSANQPTMEGQARRALLYFAQDVRMASGISGTPSASTVTFTLLTPTGTKDVKYYYNSTAAAVTVSSVSVPANSLARIDVSASTGLTLHSGLLTCVFSYYDSSGNPYTANYTDYMVGVKQVALSFTSQAGSSVNGTLSQVYRGDSPRLLLRNKGLLP